MKGWIELQTEDNNRYSLRIDKILSIHSGNEETPRLTRLVVVSTMDDTDVYLTTTPYEEVIQKIAEADK